MGTSGGLDDLLAGMAQFHKPTMADMKKRGGGATPQVASRSPGLSAAPLRNGTPAPPSGPAATPGGAPATDPFSLDHLELLVKSQSSPSLAAQRGAGASASTSSLGGLGNTTGSGKPATAEVVAGMPSGGFGAFDDLLGGLASSNRGGTSMRLPESASPTKVPAAAAATRVAVPPPPPAVAPEPASAAASPPFHAVLETVGPPPQMDEDPFALFGGPPPAPQQRAGSTAAGSLGSSSGAAAAAITIPVANIDDAFLDAFVARLPPVQQQQQHQQPSVPVAAAAVQAGSHPEFGDFLGSGEKEVLPPVLPPVPPPKPAPRPAQQAPLSSSSSGLSASATTISPTSSYGYEQRPAAGGGSSSGQPRYRVFDFVEAGGSDSPAGGAAAAATLPAGQAAAAAAAGAGAAAWPTRPSSRLGSGPLEDGMRVGGATATARPPPAGAAAGVLHADGHGQGQQGGKVAVADLSQKAAKALSSGTKWFMKASKTLVSQVQQRLDHGGGGHMSASGSGGSGGSGGVPARRPGELAPYHYDWAAQLTRVSPNSQSAALGAMSEEDRLAVQRVLDEAVLGDSFMEGPGYEGLADPGAEQAEREGSRHGFGARPGSVTDGVSRSSSRGSLGSAAGRPAAATAAAPAVASSPPAYDQLFGGRDEPAAAAPQQQQQQQQQRPAAARASAAPAAASEDLLGLSGSGAATVPASSKPAPAAAAAAAPAVDADADLLGFSGAPPPAAAAAAAAASSTSHIDDLFSVPAPRPAPSGSRPGGSSAPAPRPAPASSSSGRPTSALDSMIDLGADLPAVDTTGFGDMYEAVEGDANEPQARRALRQKKEQEKHERMMRQLAEKRARDEVDEAEKSGKVEFRTSLKPKIDGWTAGKKDNIRALLASVHTVLWEGSGWVQPSMSDMVENGKVRRVYMKANLVVHPDKVKQKGGSLEQVATADMVFDVLKAAWGKFEAANR